jgi:hypothetical protein
MNKFFDTPKHIILVKISDQLDNEIQNNQMNEDILKYLVNQYDVMVDERNQKLE